MKIYFDVCCLNRPYDDQTQDRIHLETEAIMIILKHIESKEWNWLSSGVINYEIAKTSDEERNTVCNFWLVVRLSLFLLIKRFIIGHKKYNKNLESKHMMHCILPLLRKEKRIYFYQQMIRL